MATTIRNPIEWGYDQLRHAAVAVEVTGRAVRGHPDAVATAPAVRRIDIADLKDALAKGINDFGEARSDVIFLCLLYPVAGLVIACIAPAMIFSTPLGLSAARELAFALVLAGRSQPASLAP